MRLVLEVEVVPGDVPAAEELPAEAADGVLVQHQELLGDGGQQLGVEVAVLEAVWREAKAVDCRDGDKNVATFNEIIQFIPL